MVYPLKTCPCWLAVRRYTCACPAGGVTSPEYVELCMGMRLGDVCYSADPGVRFPAAHMAA